MSTLPILRFPLLVTQEILNEMCPLDLITLSLTGRRARNLIKMILGNTSDRYLTVDIDEGYEITLQEEMREWIFLIKEHHSKKRKMEFLFSEICHISSQNPVEEFYKLLENLQNIYSCQIKKVSMNMDRFPLQNQNIITFFLKETFESFKVSGEKNSDSDSKYLFDHLKIDSILKIESLDIVSDFEGKVPEKLDDLYISNAKFIKFDQLLTLQSSRICLPDTSLTSFDVNKFLKSWMAAESHLNLRRFEVGIRFGRLRNIFEGISYEIVETFDVDPDI